MFRFLAVAFALATTLLSVAALSAAQIADPKSYIYPIKDVARLYAGSFGEMRPGHFHSGVDIKSDGESGKQIVSAAKGYVSRISVSPYGFGKALYVAHPNGTTTVYAHLLKFRDDLQKFTDSERVRLRQNSVNLYLTEGQFAVEAGELIALSGNSGSSSAPHLHYEVRSTSNQKPLNPVSLGIIQPLDNIAPMMLKLIYVECDTQNGVCYEKKHTTYELIKGEDGNYKIKDMPKVWVGREGFFILAVTDRKNGVNNTFGVYSLRAERDGECYYHFQQDGFLFSESRYCNAISYYPYQKSSYTEFYRMKRLEGLPKHMLKISKGESVIRAQAGEESLIKITATDDMGNASILSFKIRGKDDNDIFRATIDSLSPIIRPKESYKFSNGNLSVTAPQGMCYEPIHFTQKRTRQEPKFMEEISGVKIFSPEYEVLNYDTPLHLPFDLSIKCNIPEELRAQALMVYVTEKDVETPLKARYNGGELIVTSRAGGRFFAAVDLESPTIKPNFSEGADLSKRNSISFEVKDNFSGLDYFEASIDGEWIPLDLSRGRLTHTLNLPRDGSTHTLEILVRDLCGNESKLKTIFKL